MQENGVYCTN